MTNLVFHKFVQFALLLVAGLGAHVADVNNHEELHDAVESLETLNTANGSRTHGAIDIFQKIVMRSCMTDLANRWTRFSAQHDLSQITKTHTGAVIPGVDALAKHLPGVHRDIGEREIGDFGGKFFERDLNIIADKTLQEALIDHWDAEDEKWAGTFSGLAKSMFTPKRLATKLGVAAKVTDYKNNMDTIHSYGFSLHGAQELCAHLVDAPSIDALRKCEIEATTSENSKLQTWEWWLSGMSNQVKKGLAMDVDDAPFSQEQRSQRIATFILGGDIFGQTAKRTVERQDGTSTGIFKPQEKYIDDTAYTMNQNFLRFQYEPVSRLAQEGNLSKLVEFALDKQYALTMLKSVTDRVFKLEGEDSEQTKVDTLIDHEEKGLWMARTMMEKVFGFSVKRAEKYCKKKAKQEGHIPFAALDTQAKIMKEMTEPVVKRDGKCLERDGMYCPEGYSPQTKVRTDEMVRVAMSSLVWSGPVAHGIGLAIDVAFGLPGTGVALSIPGSWILWASAPLLVGLHDVITKPCACHPDLCTQSSEHGGCVIDAKAPSSNAYSWLPYPGSKCAPHQMDSPDKVQSDFEKKLQIHDTGKCVIQPCASADYNLEERQEQEGLGLRGLIGVRVEDGIALYNCLSVDGTSTGNILRAGKEENALSDDGMALSERVQLYQTIFPQ